MAFGPRPVPSALSEQQARAVLATIKFPGFEDKSKASEATLPAPSLATLSLLHIHFLVAFPFEALSLNYEPGGKMEATLSHIYSRFIAKRQGGGYCLQVNLLYREMLSFLGFRLIGVLGRVFSPVSQDWTGLTHTTTLVYLPSHMAGEERKMVYYLSDVGFGSSPHRPMLLRDAHCEYGRGSDQFRLVKRELQPRSGLEEVEDEVDSEAELLVQAQSVWILQNRKKGKDWEHCYSFHPTECFNPDYLASNHATSHPRSVPFATTIMVVRYLLHPPSLQRSGGENWVQRDALPKDLYPYHPAAVEQRMVVGTKFIVRRGDDELENKDLSTEEERVEVIKEWFGLLAHVSKEEAVEQISQKPSRLSAVAPGKEQ